MISESQPVVQIILDGGADRKNAVLDGKTPLQAARTPNMNQLASDGMSGLMDVGPPGIPFHSPAAHSLLWGVPFEDVLPRSLLEARGSDVTVEGHDFLFYFYLVAGEVRDGHLHVNRRIPDGSEDERVEQWYPETMSMKVNDLGWLLQFHPVQERHNSGVCLLDLQRGALPERIRLTDSDPFEDDFPLIRPELIDVQPHGESYRRVATGYTTLVQHLIEESVERLDASDHYDFIAPKWHARIRPPTYDPFDESWGMRGLCLTYKDGVKGTALSLGMDHERIPATGSFEERVERLLDSLDRYDFIHCHFPEPDTLSHRNAPEQKKQVLEQIDGALAPVLERRDRVLICLTCDHPTPCRPLNDHGGGNVPITLCGPETRIDAVDRFDETAVAGGGLGTINAETLMPRLVNYSNRGIMYEVCRHPGRPTYRMPAGDVHPFPYEEPLF